MFDFDHGLEFMKWRSKLHFKEIDLCFGFYPRNS